MNYKQHLILGVLLSITFIIIMFLLKDWYLTSNFNLKLILQILTLILISPLVADLDHRHGKLREWVTVVGLLLGVFGIIFKKGNITSLGVILASLAYLIYYTTKHRGYTHTIWFSVIYGCVIGYFVSNIQIGVLSFVSYYTHLIGDKLFLKLY